MNIFETEKVLDETNLFWQYPVITEKTFYEQNKNDSYYMGIPWATIKDNLNIYTLTGKLRIIKSSILKYKKHNNYYTCCQHIHFRKLIPFMKSVGIKYVYSPHKIKGEDIIDGVHILPCPLYAVNFEDETRNKEFKNMDFINKKRKYLYSFMGGYEEKIYLTNIRKDIFNLVNNENYNKDNNLIINTDDWHFNKQVYGKDDLKHKNQNKSNKIYIDNNLENNRIKYNNLLLDSRYSLCPSGSGPNSIRFWESLACGSIPVLLADTLELPYDIKWEDIIIIVKESEINNIDNILSNISIEEETKRRKLCIEIYNKLRSDFRNSFKNNILDEQCYTIFTSYLCGIEDNIIQNILRQWKVLNRKINILYFSDDDINNFFKETEHYELYSKMRNGVAIADFFRLCYINKNGGYWFDIDISPVNLDEYLDNNYDINFYDCGFKNISYMFIGGKPNQNIFNETENKVASNIKNNINKRINILKNNVVSLTGPHVIQSIVYNKIENKTFNSILEDQNKIELEIEIDNSKIKYKKLNLESIKTSEYKDLQLRYNKSNYTRYKYL